TPGRRSAHAALHRHVDRRRSGASRADAAISVRRQAARSVREPGRHPGRQRDGLPLGLPPGGGDHRRLLAYGGRRSLLVEDFIDGEEVAVEALLRRGELEVLAIFDKPDPLNGPFFEETIYVTPSRLPKTTQALVEETCARATRALGLTDGPIHAELRLTPTGPWILEVAARSIG